MILLFFGRVMLCCLTQNELVKTKNTFETIPEHFILSISGIRRKCIFNFTVEVYHIECSEKNSLSDKIRDWSKLEKNMMLVDFHPIKMCGMFSASFHSVIYTVQNNLNLKSVKVTSSPSKMEQANSAVSNLKRGAWKWEHCTLFKEWHNTEK
jgi:cell division protein FtsL